MPFELEGVDAIRYLHAGNIDVKRRLQLAAAERLVPLKVPPPAGGRGTLVSLRLDLATYFNRPGSENPVAP